MEIKFSNSDFKSGVAVTVNCPLAAKKQIIAHEIKLVLLFRGLLSYFNTVNTVNIKEGNSSYYNRVCH
jgi:hypothetical protein